MAVTYYYGPPTSDRALNLFQWFLQFCGLYMVYSSSYYKEFSLTAVVMVATLYFLSQFSIFVRIFVYITPRKLRSWYSCPKERRLLTMEEYEEEGRIETEKALKELAEYCNNSPGRYSWKTVSRLQNPQRFANFLTEGEHFTETEVAAYDQFEITEESDGGGYDTSAADMTDSGFSLHGERDD